MIEKPNAIAETEDFEFAALAGSISLTRSITRAVEDLYQATRYVESGDFGHRIQIRNRDQLGVLGQSFNSMVWFWRIPKLSS